MSLAKKIFESVAVKYRAHYAKTLGSYGTFLLRFLLTTLCSIIPFFDTAAAFMSFIEYKYLLSTFFSKINRPQV